MLLVLWSPKGGSGTSVVAASVALVAAARAGARLADLGGDQPAILGLPPLPDAILPRPLLPPGSHLPAAGPADGGGEGLTAWLAAGPCAPTEWLDVMAVPVVPGLLLLPAGATPCGPAEPGAGAALGVALRDGGLTVLDAGADTPAARALLEVADLALMVIRPCYLALRRAVADPRLGRSSGAVLVEEPGRALDAGDVAAVLGLPVLARFPVRAEIARAVDAGILRDRLPAPLAGPAASLLAGLADARGSWAA